MKIGTRVKATREIVLDYQNGRKVLVPEGTSGTIRYIVEEDGALGIYWDQVLHCIEVMPPAVSPNPEPECSRCGDSRFCIAEGSDGTQTRYRCPECS